jgi:hypothetical protein
MARELDAEDREALDKVHEKIAEQVVASMINGITTAGGGPNQLVELLESINGAIMVYVSHYVEEFDLDAVLTILQANTAARVRYALQDVKGHA